MGATEAAAIKMQRSETVIELLSLIQTVIKNDPWSKRLFWRAARPANPARNTKGRR